MEMRKSTPTLLATFLFVTGFSQSFQFEHAGGRAALAKRADLKQARVVQDIIPHRPTAYFNDFMNIVSVEIIASCSGSQVSITGNGDTLSADQKAILAAADHGTDIILKVNFTYRETASAAEHATPPLRQIDFWITPGPDVEAEYPGGEHQMGSYIQYAYISKTSELYTRGKMAPRVSVAFTVDENGFVKDATISRSSADPKIDKLALDAIAKMPRWKPAQDARGMSIKRRFIVALGSSGC
jgi:TonB family protein